VDLSEVEKFCAKYGDNIRVYPGSMKIKEDGNNYALGSRAVCVVGIGDNIQTARDISLEGIRAIKGGALWHRNDIASREHIVKSTEHMNLLRVQEP